MTVSRKAVALSAGAFFLVSAAILPTSFAQTPGTRAGDTLVVDDAQVIWIQHSEVAALIEGNVEQIELEVGMPVKKGDPIGHLYNTKAKLAVAKAKLGSTNRAGIEKAKAQLEQALSVVARNERIEKKNPGIVPREDMEKAKADWNVTKALIREAEETQKLAVAELDLAENQLKEHTITAPFDGVIINVSKHPGESVSAREPVVEMGNLDTLRVFAFVPLDYLPRLKEGMAVDFQHRGTGRRSGEGRPRGKLTFIHPELQGVGETTVKVLADFDNTSGILKPGMKGTLTIYFDTPAAGGSAGAAPASSAEPGVVPTSTIASPGGGSGGVELPPLPR